MGKFDSVLLASDFDNTLVYTAEAIVTGAPLPPVSEGNRQALAYFMDQGGTFAMATGRALPAFAPLVPSIPMNAPTILFNGAAIYDFPRKEYVHTAFLPDTVRGTIHQLLRDFPGLTFEIYHDDNSIHAINPSELTRNHLHLTHSPTVTLESIDEAPSPISKILFEEPHPYLEKLMRYLDAQPWRSEYELVTSSDYLLEMTAKGANKGDMVRQLAHILGKNPRHVYCVGDHANDMSMLRFSHIPFAPANALDCVKAIPGTHVLPDSRQDAIAALIGVLDKLYEGV